MTMAWGVAAYVDDDGVAAYVDDDGVAAYMDDDDVAAYMDNNDVAAYMDNDDVAEPTLPQPSSDYHSSPQGPFQNYNYNIKLAKKPITTSS
jgi:hypothetical protein